MLHGNHNDLNMQFLQLMHHVLLFQEVVVQ